MKKSGRGLGIFLLLAGSVFLLHELGAFSYIEETYNLSFWGIIWSLIASIFNLWPLLLIILGINIIFRNRILEVLLNLAFVVIIVANAFFGPFYYFGVPWISGITNWESVNEQLFNNQGNYKYSNQLDYNSNMIAGNSEINLGACELTIDSSKNEAAKIDSNIKGISAALGQSNDKLDVYVTEEEIFSGMQPNISRNAHIYLGDKIDWAIKITTGASKSILNLADLKVSSLFLELGAGDTEIHMGDQVKKVSMEIDGGVSNIKIYIPTSAAVLINADTGVSSDNFDTLNLVKIGESQYKSKDYETSGLKFDITISTGVSNIDLFRE
jgi:hypothetical protein